MKIWLRTPGNVFDSWSIVSTALHKALLNEDIVVYTGDKQPEKVEGYFELWWGNPAKWNWCKARPLLRIGFGLSEAQSFLSQDKDAIIKNVGVCDLLLCPSRFSARAYYEAPLDVPIQIVNLGIDSSIKLFERKWQYPLKFLVAGAAQFRKGTWLAIEAFLRFNKYYDNCSLTIWSSVPTPERKELYEEFGQCKNIKFDDLQYDDPCLVYNAHDVLISPHLSEGFGLMIPEAMATGMPCIISRASSPMEYFFDKHGWWIEMSDMYAPVSKCLHNTGGVWRLPDIDSIVTCMENAYNDLDACKLKGIAANKFVKDYLTWEHTAKKMIQYIGNTKPGSDRYGLERKKEGL